MTRALVAAFGLLVAVPAGAAEKVTSLSVFPQAITIRGIDDAPQLAVSGQAENGRLVDLTADVSYSVSNSSVLRVDPDGRVSPLTNGTAEITATYAGNSVRVPVTVTRTEAPIPINFNNRVEPILTKLGCNSGGCHGKIQGQNGFRLSLLGFDPELDYTTLVKEGRGRRLLPSAPDSSLFLQKAAGIAPHGGGRKLDPASDEYKLLRRWIASGLPFGSAADPTVTKVTVFPESRVLNRQARQQLVVHAHYSDGTIEDVTRLAQYESNETDVATVSEAGLVRSLSATGQAAVMVRYLGSVTVFRTVLPRPGPPVTIAFEPSLEIDRLVLKKWKELNIAPSEQCSDEQFIRRVSLDVTGTLPTADAVVAFVADPDAAKRDKLVDRLVETPEYAYLFANKWADVLRVKRRNQADRAAGTFAFHDWIYEAVASDLPYDAFVRAIVCAVGDETKSPPTVWYKEVTTPEQFVDDVSQVFLGQRLACANCHHHPYEKWSQDDYWGIAAFFARVGKKAAVSPGDTANRQNQMQVIFTRASGSVTNKRTNKVAIMKPLDGEEVKLSVDQDPRAAFADWLTAPSNPFFARAVANRYWAHFFGRGIVDPLDDMRVTNPPSNPELLDALAKSLVDHGYSLKELVKVICKSRVYQLSATPNATNQGDKQSFARYYPKRLSAEVVFDAVSLVTGSPAEFGGLPRDRNAPRRALMLPDESFGSYFLDVLGRPQRISACECERVSEASLAMTLHLLNSQEVQDKISRGGGRADRLARDPRPDDAKVTELFLTALGRKPTAGQMKQALDHIAKHEKAKKTAYENILWALVNSKAFLFNQ